MKTSVVLAAYNGEKFILEQLESIRNQTVPIDEVIIVDDQSTDRTVEVCKQFISKFQLLNWRIDINESNLKTVRSFWNTIPKANGDIIFLSDQDDIWMENRVETFLYYFSKKTDALSIASTFTRFNENTVLSQKVKHPFYEKNGIKKITVGEYCEFPFYLGMSIAFKKELLSKIHNKFNGMPHEIFLNFFATINDGFYYLDKVLTQRRSYPQSVSNSDLKKMAEQQFQGDEYLMRNVYYYKIILYFFELIENESAYVNNYKFKKDKIAVFKQTQWTRVCYLKDKDIIQLFKSMLMPRLPQKKIIKDFLYIIKK